MMWQKQRMDKIAEEFLACGKDESMIAVIAEKHGANKSHVRTNLIWRGLVEKKFTRPNYKRKPKEEFIPKPDPIHVGGVWVAGVYYASAS